jgi:hypothetical protein
MRTYPIHKADGSLRGFEISLTWISMGTIKRLLRSVDGVADLKRQFFSDDRLVFTYHGEKCVVNEPFGDNSRYWIGLENPDGSTLDIRALHRVFEQYNGPTIRALGWFRRVVGG